MKLISFFTAAFLCLICAEESPARTIKDDFDMEQLTLTREWDKTFPLSDKVSHCKVTFHNRYGITLAADLYIPKDAGDRTRTLLECAPAADKEAYSDGDHR